MQPISPSLNHAVQATAAARSASLGKVTNQPSAGLEGAAGSQGALGSARASTVSSQTASLRTESFSASASLVVQKDDEEKKLSGLVALSLSSFRMNAQFSSSSQVSAYAQASGAANGGGASASASVGLSVNFSA